MVGIEGRNGAFRFVHNEWAGYEAGADGPAAVLEEGALLHSRQKSVAIGVKLDAVRGLLGRQLRKLQGFSDAPQSHAIIITAFSEDQQAALTLALTLIRRD